MRTTEENIVYQLLNSIRAAELNSDEVITERLIRSLMRIHRAELIVKYSIGGFTATDDCFQNVPITLTKYKDLEYITPIPNIIRLPNNFGTKLMSKGFHNIPILSEEEYQLSKKNPINKYNPKAMLLQGNMLLYVGQPTHFGIDGSPGLSVLIDCIKKNEEVLASFILDDPDDGAGYDWTKSEYPMPSEIVDELKKNLLRRDFNIIIGSKSDQIPNAKNDTLRYHDQGKVQE